MKRNWIAEYTKIKSCIPEKWKTVLKENSDMQNDEDLIENADFYLAHDEIRINENQIYYKKIKQKEIYFACLYPQSPPSCLHFWGRIFEKDIDLQSIFAGCENQLCNKKVLDFHWKTLHHAVYSEVRLKQMNRSNGKCKLCHVKDETLCHLFYDCIHVKPVWQKLQVSLKNVFGYDLPLNSECIILGVSDNEIELSCSRMIYNFAIFNSKWCIWKHRNNVKYNGKQVNSTINMLKTITSFCKEETSLLLQRKGKPIKLEHRININNLLELLENVTDIPD